MDESQPLSEIIAEFTSEASSFPFLGFNGTSTKLQMFLFNLFAFGDIENHPYHANGIGGVIVIATSASIDPARGSPCSNV